MDFLQIWINQSENFCYVKNYIKSPIAAAIGLSCTFSTVLKFYILCIRKSMPEMNENVLAKYAIFGIMGIVLSFNVAKYTQGVSHSFYFGVKSNSNSFGKKGVKSTPPLLFDFKRSESTTPLPTPLKTLISIFF